VYLQFHAMKARIVRSNEQADIIVGSRITAIVNQSVQVQRQLTFCADGKNCKTPINSRDKA